MKGRKPVIPPSETIAAIVHFKDRVVTEINGKKGKYLSVVKLGF
jgi:hypothetical protein